MLVSLVDAVGQTKEVSVNGKQDTVKFIQMVCYNGMEEESLVQTCVRLYKKTKTQSLQSLPADPDSMNQNVLRVYHQIYYWMKFHERMIEPLSCTENGWQFEEEEKVIVPLWFQGLLLQSFC